MTNISTIGKHCFGCRACEQICPKQCIKMHENEEGFLYPIVDESNCLHCHRCLDVCPADHLNDSPLPLKVYALKNKDKERLYNSASGGASDALAKYVIDHGGVVFGVAYIDNMKPAHIKCSTGNELNRIQSSKYVASDTQNTFTEVKKEILSKKLVLYTGTPCQIKALELFLGKTYDNLITISIVCHGTPSFKAFRTYLDSIEQKYDSKVVDYNFRCKKYGWGLYIFIAIITSSGKKKILYRRYSQDLYFIEFEDGSKNCRESCYECRFATKNRVGDLCVGDYWGIEKAHPGFKDKLGVSLVTINTKKGMDLLNKINDRVELLDTTLNNIIKMQSNMKHPTIRNDDRNTFYQHLDVSRYANYKEPLKCKIKWLVRRCMPQPMITLIKKITRNH